MKIKSLIYAWLLIIMSLVFIPDANAETGTYYLGDAIIYNGQVIIGSTNLGGGLDSAGEKIVIFNNSAILVLDQNLKIISHISVTL